LPAIPVGARLARDGVLGDAIACKPCSYGSGIFLGINYWPQAPVQQFKVY
jgi:hypothetical protein